MLMRKLINGHSLSSNGLIRSRSCGNFCQSTTNLGVLSRIAIKESIYDNCACLKANKLTRDYTNILRNATQKAKSRQKDYINSFYANCMKTKFQTRYDDLYLTAAKHKSPSIDLSSNSRNTDLSHRYRLDDDFFNTQLKQSKMKLEIGSLYAIPKSGGELAACCRSILLLKNITAIENNRIDKEKSMYMKELVVKRKQEQELINKEEEMEVAVKNFDSYLAFLVKKLEHERKMVYELSYQHNMLRYEVIKLVGMISKEKEKLDKCLEERNFLFKMKEKTRELPVDYLLLTDQESNNSYLKNIMGTLKSKVTIKALVPVLEGKNKGLKKEEQRSNEESIIQKLAKDISKLTLQQREELKEKQFRLKNFLNRQYIPFDYPEDFMTEINNLERINITLLASNEKTKTQTDQYKAERDQLKIETENYEKFMQELLDQKEKTRDDLVKKYEYLINVQKNILTSSLLKGSSSLSNISRNKTRFASIFGGGESLEQMRYKNMRKQFPIEFSCIHNRLVKAIEMVISDTNFGNKIVTTFKQEETDAILHTKFNNNNKELIHSICLKLLRLYEKSVVVILAKNKQFMSEPSIKQLISKLINERQEKLKVKNAQDQKLRLEMKREEEKKKIVEKNDKMYFLPKRRRLECHMTRKRNENEHNVMSNMEPTFEELIQYTEELE